MNSPTGIGPVSVICTNEEVRTSLERLASLAGIVPAFSSTVAAAPPAVLLLEETPAATPSVRASFHRAYAPYFAEGSLVLSVREEASELLELMIEAGSTGRGAIIGVLGAHGGVGASTIASTLALLLASEASTALIDADPYSAGHESWCGISGEGGLRWADVAEEEGVLVPGRLASALPARGKLRLLGPDERGGMPAESALPIRALSALSQTHTYTIIDLPRYAGAAYADMLAWCDVHILVAGTWDEAGRAAGRALARMPEGAWVVINRAAGGGQAAGIGEAIGAQRVFPVRLARNLTRDVEHGLRLDSHPRSARMRDMVRLAKAVREDVL